MIGNLPPGIILIVGALLIPLLRGRLQQVAMLALPIVSAAHLYFNCPAGTTVTATVFSYELTPVHVDRLNLVWGYIFHIAAFVGALYAVHVKDSVQHLSALIYMGAGIGAVFAGDLITLFIYWELTAISSVFLIWASGTERAYRAGMRYLIVQVGSGVLLLSGILLHLRDTGSLAFVEPFKAMLSTPENALFEGLNSAGTLLIFIAFGIKAAFPLLHNWLQDAYPEGTPTGTVILSAFTTKLAIYALARGFAGTELLITIGATMTAFPVFFAVIENDLRRVLAYSLNNQLGFMVVGIGIGSELALNGTAAHAFAHILYKALLFMSMGAVLHRVGTCKATELGGLYKSMPWTTVFCIIGAASISAFPLFSGFVTKSMILKAVAEEHHTVIFIVLLVASVGVMEHSGIKIPFFGFFGHDSGKRVKEAPLNMLVAMGMVAALCILIGVFPGPLYSILPYPVHEGPYDMTHVVTQLQLLLWAALAFAVLMKFRLYPDEVRATNLDFDWTYRKVLPAVVGGIRKLLGSLRDGFSARTSQAISGITNSFRNSSKMETLLENSRSTGTMVILATVLLLVYLLLYYI